MLAHSAILQHASHALTDAQRTAAADQAAGWLESAQNFDGSWGQEDTERMLYTAEAVRSLRAFSRRGAAYQSGIAWLENHTASNVDFLVRQTEALLPNGDDTIIEQFRLLALEAGGTGLSYQGWGITGAYQADALDSALALLLLARLDPANLNQHSDAVGTLFVVQANGTWSIGQPTSSLPAFPGDVASTVVAATFWQSCLELGPTCANSATLSLVAQLLDDTHAALASNFPSDDLGRAQVAAYFSRLRASPPIPLSSIASMIDLFVIDQGQDGSWQADPLTTAEALGALAAWLGTDPPDSADVVQITDERLRRAVNGSLGNPAMDAITLGELRRLRVLDVSKTPITDLASIGAADNLEVIDISGNPCLADVPGIATWLQAIFPSLQQIVTGAAGDIDGDATVDSRDHLLLMRDVAGIEELQGERRLAADLNFDGRLDSRDLYWHGRALLDESLAGLCP